MGLFLPLRGYELNESFSSMLPKPMGSTSPRNLLEIQILVPPSRPVNWHSGWGSAVWVLINLPGGSKACQTFRNTDFHEESHTCWEPGDLFSQWPAVGSSVMYTVAGLQLLYKWTKDDFAFVTHSDYQPNTAHQYVWTCGKRLNISYIWLDFIRSFI